MMISIVLSVTLLKIKIARIIFYNTYAFALNTIQIILSVSSFLFTHRLFFSSPFFGLLLFVVQFCSHFRLSHSGIRYNEHKIYFTLNLSTISSRDITRLYFVYDDINSKISSVTIGYFVVGVR